MQNRLMLIPVGSSVGLTSVSLGLVRALEQNNIDVGFFKPISQPVDGDFGPDKSTEIIMQTSTIKPAKPLSLHYVEKKYSEGQGESLLEEIVGNFEKQAKTGQTVVIEGLVSSSQQSYTGKLNRQIATALGAKVIFVCAPVGEQIANIEELLEITANNYGGVGHPQLIGCIFNKVGAPSDLYSQLNNENSDIAQESLINKSTQYLESLKLFKHDNFKLFGCIPWDDELVAPRVCDLVAALDATLINIGESQHRRVRSINVCARTVANMVDHFSASTLIVTPGDRSDVIVATCLAAMNGIKLGAVLLTGGIVPDSKILTLCKPALDLGLPLLLTQGDTWNTTLKLHHLNVEVPIDDLQRIEKVKNHAAQYLDANWISTLIKTSTEQRHMSPAAFRYLLSERAKKANKLIVLPEGNEPRTIKAAIICGERQLAHTVLLGEKNDILQQIANQGLVINDYVKIIEPQTIVENYVDLLVAKRQHKGMTIAIAREQLEDNVMLATMMLAAGDVDGLVSGAVHTTANTIRPAMQIIKTADEGGLVSSIFFMLLPEQVLVYGDCAINPDPNAEQLAEIAIQSADSARAFGITPKVAMLSYSTGASGQGNDVEKVRAATAIAQAKRPDLLIDGPLQYDAAVMKSVALSKAPGSNVAGQANVLIFPDLNTGNTTYKAVQRSADLVSIGPMLQGMKKPVNDLSRGALVEDIIYTIALTAIQAVATREDFHQSSI